MHFNHDDPSPHNHFSPKSHDDNQPGTTVRQLARSIPCSR